MDSDPLSNPQSSIPTHPSPADVSVHDGTSSANSETKRQSIANKTGEPRKNCNRTKYKENERRQGEEGTTLIKNELKKSENRIEKSEEVNKQGRKHVSKRNQNRKTKRQRKKKEENRSLSLQVPPQPHHLHIDPLSQILIPDPSTHEVDLQHDKLNSATHRMAEMSLREAPSSKPSISVRRGFRVIPGVMREPTSTLVLTSATRRFVDIRIFLPPGPDQPFLPNETGCRFLSRLDWAFAGTSSTRLVSQDDVPNGIGLAEEQTQVESPGQAANPQDQSRRDVSSKNETVAQQTQTGQQIQIQRHTDIKSEETIDQILDYHKHYLGGFPPGPEQETARAVFRKAANRYLYTNLQHGPFGSKEEAKLSETIREIVTRSQAKHMNFPDTQARASGEPPAQSASSSEPAPHTIPSTNTAPAAHGPTLTSPSSPPIIHSSWTHEIDSRDPCPTILDASTINPCADKIHTLELGCFLNPSTNQYHPIESMWEDLKPLATSSKLRYSVVIELVCEEKQARGLVVRVGGFCQGLLRVGNEISLERWVWVAGEGRHKKASGKGQGSEQAKKKGDGSVTGDGKRKEKGNWVRVVRLGDYWLPCGIAFKEEMLDVGQTVTFGEFKWNIVEVERW